MIDNIKTYASVFLALVAVAGVVGGWASFIDTRYAKTSSIAAIEVNLQALDERITLAELYELLEEALTERKRLRKILILDPEDEEAREELEEIEEEIKHLKERIRELKEKK